MIAGLHPHIPCGLECEALCGGRLHLVGREGTWAQSVASRRARAVHVVARIAKDRLLFGCAENAAVSNQYGRSGSVQYSFATAGTSEAELPAFVGLAASC